MMTLLHDRQLVGGVSSEEMLEVMARSAEGHHSWLRGRDDFPFEVLHTKLGRGDTKGTKDDPRHPVFSEASIIQHRYGRKFVVAWQNVILGDDDFAPVAGFIRDAIDDYLGLV